MQCFISIVSQPIRAKKKNLVFQHMFRQVNASWEGGYDCRLQHTQPLYCMLILRYQLYHLLHIWSQPTALPSSHVMLHFRYPQVTREAGGGGGGFMPWVSSLLTQFIHWVCLPAAPSFCFKVCVC